MSKKSFLFFLLWILLGIWLFSQYFISQERPNVLFITVDTLRSDHLGCYGYSQIKTPHIDGLAENGTLFKDAIAQAPLTFPSLSSLFTSTYPQYNQVRDNGREKLNESAMTLAEIMKDNGYATAAFVSTFVLDKKFGLDQGFDVYDDRTEKPKQKRIIKFMDDERTGDKVTDAAIEWLKGKKDEKFFLWVHYYDPHTIYNPPSPYKELYPDSPYDGEIAFTDAQIGRLLQTLKEFNLKENTLIVFAADHGEGLGEHDEATHGVFVYDTTLKVPLIFSYPQWIPKGKKVEGTVRLVDIVPTLLDFLDFRKPKEMQGESLYRVIKSRQRVPPRPAYSESLYAKTHFNWAELRSFRTGPWKYIRSAEPELYNIKKDPKELFNLAGNRMDIVEEIDAKLSQFIEETRSEKAKDNQLPIDEETREKLMSLGYLQGSQDPDSTEPLPREMIKLMEKISLADRMANQGLLQEAIKIFQEVLADDPNNIEANLHIAQCFRELGQYEPAMKHFKKVAYFKPDDPEAHDGLGNIYKSMGKVDAAFEEFSVAHLLDPENPAIINNLGWCYQQKYQFDKAMEYYQKALAMDDQIATAHANMAICYRVKGQPQKALESLKVAIDLDPKLAFAHSELCATIATLGDIDKAIPYCQKGIELDPEGLDGYNNLAVCYERKGEYQKALENYQEALRIAPWNPLIHSNAANAYMQLKAFEQARFHLNKALELNPGYQKAILLLRILKQKEKM